MSAQHCPRCKSEEWFPGAACWHCGWEAKTATEAHKAYMAQVRELAAAAMTAREDARSLSLFLHKLGEMDGATEARKIKDRLDAALGAWRIVR